MQCLIKQQKSSTTASSTLIQSQLQMTMKTLVSLLIFSLCIIIGSCRVLGDEVDCVAIGGTVPVPIFNSPYTILPNTSLCCPKYIGDFCKDEKEIAGDKCKGRGLVYEPCHLCKTCARLAGESCGGHQNIYGTCDEGLECVNVNITDPSTDQNYTHGLCYGKGMPSVPSRLFTHATAMTSELIVHTEYFGIHVSEKVLFQLTIVYQLSNILCIQ